MLCSAEVSDAVYSSMERAVVHSSTFSQNQLAMVAGLATLPRSTTRTSSTGSQRTGEAFTKALRPLVERYEFLHEVRGMGPHDRPRLRRADDPGHAAPLPR